MLESMKNRYEILLNFRIYLEKIKSSALRILNEAEIYLFGSALEGKLVAGSDIDILIVANVPKSHLKRAEFVANIEENAGLPLSNPFHIHLLDSAQFDVWMDIFHLKIEKI